MRKSMMDDLSLIIKSQIELYEDKMSHAMAKGNEKDMRKINSDFDREVGKNVCTFAELAGEPLKSTLNALFNDSCAEDYGTEGRTRPEIFPNEPFFHLIRPTVRD